MSNPNQILPKTKKSVALSGTVAGNTAQPHGLNRVGLRRRGFSAEEIDALRKQMKQRLGQGAGSLELPRDMFQEQAVRRVTLGLVIGEIIKQNGIKIDEERVRKTIEEFASSYEQPDEVVKYYYGNQEQLAAVQNVVLEDQVVDWVLQQTEVVDEPTSFSALTAEG